MTPPIFSGKSLRCALTAGGIAELTLDNSSASVNKFDQATLGELAECVAAIKSRSDVTGLIIASAKSVFVVGADITEFLPRFQESDATLKEWLRQTHNTFAAIEDLPYPTVAAIGGIALGGGCEVALSTTYRVASPEARIGLPETKLGIIPGWGGTVRLPRLIGADNAIEWIAAGSQHRPDAAYKVGAIDAVLTTDGLLAGARKLIERAQNGELDWKARTAQKKSPLTLLSPVEKAMIFEGAKAFVAGQTKGNYPAPLAAIDAIAKGADLEREGAADLELDAFIASARTPVAESLITIFLSDQFNKKQNKKRVAGSTPPEATAVLGAGIMGGGIAYQSASRGVPIVMKDINNKALDLGMSEATKLLTKQVERGKINTAKLGSTLAQIRPTLSYDALKSGIGLVVEAVVEDEKIKKSVLAEVEGLVPPETVLTSNTSTISITRLAQGLKRPASFCGMHFFNPVHRMPLVEVIRGKETSDATVAAVVAYSQALGKTPIVVGDCPGFLVNRILFPYFHGLTTLTTNGVDFTRVDKVMERFGWPMGPAYLLDVIGIDTAVHCAGVMAQGFPDRMTPAPETPMAVLHGANRLGQKNGKGFYAYEPDRKGKPKKKKDESVAVLLKPLAKSPAEVTDEEIVDRMMLPMINEAARCLEEGIAGTPMEVDLGMLYGLGFPPFRGGVLKYADQRGLSAICERTASLRDLGACYEPPKLLEDLARQGKTFYDHSGAAPVGG